MLLSPRRHVGRPSAHAFPHGFNTGETIRRCETDFLKIFHEGRVAEEIAQLRQEGFDFGEDAPVLCVCIVEHFGIDGAVHNKRGGHIPIADDHADVSAVRSEKDGGEFLYGLGIESLEEAARFAHYGVAALLIESKKEGGAFGC